MKFRVRELFVNGFKLSAAGLCLACAADALAAKPEAGIPFEGGWTLIPELDLGYLYDSNLYRQEDDETDAQVGVVKPGLGLRYLRPGDSYLLAYAGSYGFHSTTSRDNYSDNDVVFSAEMNQTGRNRLSLHASYDEGHDPRGTARTENLAEQFPFDDVDEWATGAAQATYVFGAPTAALNLTASADYKKKSYTNNKYRNAVFDFETVGGLVGFRYRLTPATAALFDLQYHEITFDELVPGFTSLNGDEIRARLGAQWQPSSTLQLRALAGAFKRDNDTPDRKDLSTLDWETVLNYQPQPQTLLILEGGHNTQETYLGGVDFIDVKRFGGRWVQTWTDRFNTGLNGFYNRYQFRGEDRNDKVWAGGVYLEYDISGSLGWPRIITTRLSFDLEDRNSDAPLLDFKRHVGALNVIIAL